MKEKIVTFILKTSIYDVNDFAVKNGIYFTRKELEFTYKYLKDNINNIIQSKKIDFESIRHQFSSTNYMKIRNLAEYYINKYHYLF